MRANMMQSFASDPISDPDFYEDCGGRRRSRSCSSAPFFHAAIQERQVRAARLEHPLRVQRPRLEDLSLGPHVLRRELARRAAVDALETLVYLVGECNYGGRVTDGHDRRTLMSILTDESGGPFHANIMLEDYVFSPSACSGARAGIEGGGVGVLQGCPSPRTPRCSLHANADIAKDQKETDLPWTACC